MGFTKLDEGIIQSSIMGEDSDTFKVWITILASTKEDGVATISSVFLSGVCHLPIESVDKAIKTLENPDLRSRSPEEDGRRIRKVVGGWYVINYLKYRQFLHSSKPESARKRRYREKVKDGVPDILGRVPNVHGHSASASSSSSSSSSIKEEKKEEISPGVPFEYFWERYPKKVEKEDAKTNWDRLIKAGVDPLLILQATEGYAKVEAISGTEPKYIKNPPTFLAKDRWRDYLPGGEGLRNATSSKENEIRKERMVGGGTARVPDMAQLDKYRARREYRDKLLEEREPAMNEARERGDLEEYRRIDSEISQSVVDHFREIEKED